MGLYLFALTVPHQGAGRQSHQIYGPRGLLRLSSDSCLMAPTSDALAASALVTAVLAALFTLWQADVSAALALPKSDDRANRKDPRRQVRAILLFRALPLLLATSATFLIMSGRTIGILLEAVACAQSSRCLYDDVGAMMALTETLVLGLCVAVVAQVFALKAKLDDLDSP